MRLEELKSKCRELDKFYTKKGEFIWKIEEYLETFFTKNEIEELTGDEQLFIAGICWASNNK